MGAQGTRAGSTGDINTTQLKAENYGFGVFAYSTGNDDCYTSETWNTKTPNFMYNQQVTYNSTGEYWTYTPIKYWPNDFVGKGQIVDATKGATGSDTYGGKVSFFAYAPYVAAAQYTTPEAIDGRTSAFYANGSSSSSLGTGIVAMTSNTHENEPEVKYVMSETETAQVDLLWGLRGNADGYSKADGVYETPAQKAAAYNTDLTKQTVDETVDFRFKHALAKIGGNISESNTGTGVGAQSGVNIILDIDNNTNASTPGKPSTTISGGEKDATTLVTVNEIKIQDIASYNADTNEANTTSTAYLYNTGWFNFAKGTWSDVSLISGTSGTKYENTTNTATMSNSALALNAAIAEPSSVPTFSSGNWNMNGVLSTTSTPVYATTADIPGIFVLPANADQSFVVTITYTVRTYDEKLPAPATGESTCEKHVQKISNVVTIPANSLESNKYYKLLIHLGLTSVKFSATVADWEEVGNTDSNNDGTVDNPKDADKEVWLPSNVI